MAERNARASFDLSREGESLLIDTIMFDLDGTLLPIDQKEFIVAYFGAAIGKLAPLGYDKDRLVASLWAGTRAMMINDGTLTNAERFWQVFEKAFGHTQAEMSPLLDAFYHNEFNDVKRLLTCMPPSREIVYGLRDKGYRLVLATNPLFPAVAVAARLRWIGLFFEDFEHVTSIENSRYCKPDLRYFEEILQAIGKTPEKCMMVGNNAAEDMSALRLGMAGFLVTDCLENEAGEEIGKFRHGSLLEFAAYCAAWDDVK
jgi:FMN phosphatase YigB (HAD superfamily)